MCAVGENGLGTTMTGVPARRCGGKSREGAEIVKGRTKLWSLSVTMRYYTHHISCVWCAVVVCLSYELVDNKSNDAAECAFVWRQNLHSNNEATEMIMSGVCVCVCLP